MAVLDGPVPRQPQLLTNHQQPPKRGTTMSSTADRALIADCLETYVDTLGSGRHKFNTEQGRRDVKHVRYDLADEASCTALLRRAPGPDSFASGYLCVCLR